MSLCSVVNRLLLFHITRWRVTELFIAVSWQTTSAILCLSIATAENNTAKTGTEFHTKSLPCLFIATAENITAKTGTEFQGHTHSIPSHFWNAQRSWLHRPITLLNTEMSRRVCAWKRGAWWGEGGVGANRGFQVDKAILAGRKHICWILIAFPERPNSSTMWG